MRAHFKNTSRSRLWPLYIAAAVFAIPSISYANTEPNSDPLSAPMAAQHPAYLNTQLSVEQRVADLISRLSIDEKAALLDHQGPTIERLGIRSDQWNQCLHGVSWTKPTTLFPIPTALAATWDPDLVHRSAAVISDEARAIYNGWHDDPHFTGEAKGLIYRSPVINILRNPYWGRNDEAYSEDPFLCGRMAVAYVTGLQGDDPKYLKVAATLKHFAVNNVEKNRTALSATVSERMLHEYWLPHWRDAVVEGHACSVMASYNQINGVHNVLNKLLLTDILKNSWGFEGFVVSDLGGVHNQAMVVDSLNAGCDFSDKQFGQFIPEAVRSKELSEARVNDALTRVLKVRFELGEFDPPDMVPYRKISMSVICSPEHRALSLQASRESMVLLKNQDNLLPLDKTKVHSIALLGPLADHFVTGEKAYVGNAPRQVVSIRQGLQDRFGPGVQIDFLAAAQISKSDKSSLAADAKAQIQAAVELAKRDDLAILCVGSDLSQEGEGHDRERLDLPGNQEELVEAIQAVSPKTIVLLVNAGPLTVPWIKDHVPAILQVWWSGEEQGHAVAETLLGDNDPAGRLPYTVYNSPSQVPPQNEYDISKGFTYMYVKGEPLWPFGFGLSYTQFQYSNIHLSSEAITPAEDLAVQVDLANIGTCIGDEVVQLYTRAIDSRIVRPAEELRGFQRITLQPGERRTLHFTVPASKLAYWSEKEHRFIVDPGTYEIQIGASCEDIRQRAQFKVN